MVGGGNGDGFDAALARFTPADVAYDSGGNLYVADSMGNRIRRIDAQTNVVTTVAGTGELGFGGDGGPATQAKLFFPGNVVIDANGDIYFSDQLNHRVRRIAAGSNTITTVAGTGATTYNGDNIPAVEASLSFPGGLAFLPDGSLLITDAGHNRIRRVAQGFITTVAGTGSIGYNGDGFAAREALITNPSDVATDSAGNFYISDTGNCRIRLVQAQTQLIFTIAGINMCGFSGNNGPANAAKLNGPSQIALRNNQLYLTESFAPRVRRIDLNALTIHAFAGVGFSGSSGDGGAATDARLDSPAGLAVDANGAVAIGEQGTGIIRDVQQGIIHSIAGQSNGDGFAANVAKIDPRSVVLTPQGVLYIADAGGNRIRRVPTSFNPVSTAAGNGVFGFSGDNGSATQAMLASPLGVAQDDDGNIYFSDQLNHRIRRIAAGSNVITTIAGIGTPSFSGDNGPATSAGLSFPSGLMFGPDGNLYIADSSNNRIRSIAPNGRISTVVGTGSLGYNGDGILAKNASLSNPTDVIVDTDNNLFIADRNSCRIRRVDADSGLISTVAGTGRCAYSGDGGLAVNAELNGPEYLALLENRYLFFSESFTPRVRRVDLFTGIVTRIAGNGLPASTGDGGPGLNAQLEMPAGLALDKAQAFLYIADNAAGRVRRLRVETVPPSTFTPTRTRTATPTNTPTVTLTATVTQTRTATPTFTPSDTPTQTHTFTVTVTRTPTATATVTSTVTRTATPSPSHSPTFTATRTDTATPTITLTFTPSPTATRTRTSTPTDTPLPTATFTATLTRTITPTRTPSDTPTQTFTPTQTLTRTATSTLVPTATSTVTLTRTATPTASPSRTITNTSTPTFTSTITRTRTPTATDTRTPTNSPTSTITLTRTQTATQTRTATSTATPIPASATSTATRTRTSTATPVPPSPTATITLTRTVTQTRTASGTATPVLPTATVTLTRTASPTATAVPPSATPTLTRTVTRTFTSAPPTATPVPATATVTLTRTASPTVTPVPPTATVTLTRTISPTATAVPPSATATLTRTVTRTFTPAPPTSTAAPATPTQTRAATSTFTRTATSTATPVPPTSAPSATRTATRTSTLVPTATATPTRTFSPTVTRTSTSAAQPTSTQTLARSNTPTPTVATPTGTPTLAFTRTRTRTPTEAPASPTRTSTAPPSSTSTRAPTFTPAPNGTPTFTLRPTGTATITRTPTATVTLTATRTASVQPTGTQTFTPTATRTTTRTSTPFVTFTPLPTFTSTVTPRIATATRTVTPIATGSVAATATRTRTSTPTVSNTATPVSTSTSTPVSSSTPTRTLTPTVTATTTLVPTETRPPNTSTRTPAATSTKTPNFCVGDCNGDSFVTLPEMNAVVVRVALCGGAPVGQCGSVGTCARADSNGDGRISASEVSVVSENAHNGCP